jgi:hypothetical protein
MGRPKKYEKLIRFYLDSKTLDLLESLPGNQSEKIRYLIELGTKEVSLHHTDTAAEVKKLSDIVINLYAEITKLKQTVAMLVKERNGL